MKEQTSEHAKPCSPQTKQTLYDSLAARVAKTPALCALSYYGRHISYRQLLASVERTASALYALGVRAGDVVSICLPNLPETVYAFYAINRLGAVANLLHPLSAVEELSFSFRLTKSRFLLALDLLGNQLAQVDACPQTVVFFSVADSMPPWMALGYHLTQKKPAGNALPNALTRRQFYATATSVLPPPTAHPNDTAAILYSGGTTGKPKGILLSNHNFHSLAAQSIASCGCLQARDRVLSVMPFFHGFGLGVCMHTVLTFGGTAVLLPQCKAALFASSILCYRPQVIAGVPALYEALLRDKACKGKSFAFLKCAISGGDAMRPETKQQVNQLLATHGSHATVREGYGLTECVTGSCLMPNGSENLRSVGYPYPDMVFQIVQPQSEEPLPCGTVGEIILRGPTVMQGYLNEPEETAQTLRRHADGHVWLHTGDLGSMDAEGYVYFSQRQKRMIVTNGYNIYPQTIEAALHTHKAVQQCAVVGIPDALRGQVAKAFVVLQPEVEWSEVLRAELLAACKHAVAAYAVPRSLVAIASLPMTKVGKIDYPALQRDGAEEGASTHAQNATAPNGSSGASGDCTHEV